MDADRGSATAPRLSRERAAVAALALIDRDGLDAFSMRGLGRELGVDPMAVYHHVPSRQALFDAVVEVVWRGVEPPAATGRWEHDLRELAHAVRAVLRRHAAALPIIATRSSGPAGLRILDHGIAVCRRAGMPAWEAFTLVSAASSFLIGHALAEVGVPPDGPTQSGSGGQEPTPGSVPGGLVDLADALGAGPDLPAWDELFAAGLETLLLGARARLDGGVAGEGA